MSISELVSQARTDVLDDSATPYLWSDEQLTRYADEACLEACKRAPLVKRAYTLNVVAGTAAYSIDASVRQIYLAKLTAFDNPLSHVSEEDLTITIGPSYRLITGQPTAFTRRKHTITLYPIPVANDTLVLSTSNTPDDNFDVDDDIDSVYHKGLLHYIAYKAYLLRDADTYNPVKAAEHLASFDRFFGMPKSAKYDSVAQATPMYSTVISGRMA
jgi:hypothetical protein